MDGQIDRTLKNVATNIINHRETNFVVTAIFGFITIYVTLVALFHRSFIHPFTPPNGVIDFNGFNRYSIQGNNSVTNESPDYGVLDFPAENFMQTMFSLFFLWMVSLILGRVASYFFLPPLLGMLIVGIIVANVASLRLLLYIHPSWNEVLRQIAFVLILIRCGIGIEIEVLKKSWLICVNIGVLSATFEVLAIFLFVHFVYYLPLNFAIVFAYVLASTSPAVTVPTMLEMEAAGRGTTKGIPTAILASAAMDNIYCLSAFTVLITTVFSKNDNLAFIITKIPAEFLMGCLFGILIGLFLWSFPRYDAHLSHFIRAFLLFTTCVAFFFGTLAVQCRLAGPIAIILVCIVASARWSTDNRRSIRSEKRAYKIAWDLFFLPFLFSLIGLIFDLSKFTWPLLGKALATIGVGLIARIIFLFFVTLCTNLTWKEKVFMSFCFTPKATVQAALLPSLVQYANSTEDSQFISFTCILAILITAPIGQLIILLLGNVFLEKKADNRFYSSDTGNYGSAKNISAPFHVTSLSGKLGAARTYDGNGLSKVPQPTFQNGTNSSAVSTSVADDESVENCGHMKSDKDNRLRLKVTPNGTTTTAVSTKNSSQTFEEIDQRSFENFKRQHLSRIREQYSERRRESGDNIDSPSSESVNTVVQSRNYYQYPQPTDQRNHLNANKPRSNNPFGDV